MKIAALDIETLDLNKTTALIFDIGIVVITDFELPSLRSIKEVGIRPALAEQLALGRTVSQDTVAFHTKNYGGVEAFTEHLTGHNSYERMSVKSSIDLIQRTLKDVDELWINGLSFDPVLVESLALQVDMKLPWDFRKETDVRSIRAQVPFPELEKRKAAHDAIKDAHWNLEIATAFKDWLASIPEHLKLR
jgi:hypothetical protein